MEDLYLLAKGYAARYPEGNSPFQIATRLLEECGEVAKEVNHFENSGIKVQKYGEPKKQAMADEIKQAIGLLMQLVIYYNVEEELQISIDSSLNRMREEKLI